MKLFRTINSRFDPNQPPIQWEGDVRGIIAARREAEMAKRNAGARLRVVWHVANVRTINRPTIDAPMEVEA